MERTYTNVIIILKEMICMSYIKRGIEKIIKDIEKTFPVIMLIGPRQVGKTTILKQITKNKKINYVTLDDLKYRQQQSHLL